MPDMLHDNLFIWNDNTNSSILLILQEEGWLMGIKESTNEKGMFPANFTRPIWGASTFPPSSSTLGFIRSDRRRKSSWFSWILVS